MPEKCLNLCETLGILFLRSKEWKSSPFGELRGSSNQYERILEKEWVWEMKEKKRSREQPVSGWVPKSVMLLGFAENETGWRAERNSIGANRWDSRS